MWWIVAIVAIVAFLALFEWRYGRRPEVPGLREVHSALRTGRVMTGGHNTDERRY